MTWSNLAKLFVFVSLLGFTNIFKTTYKPPSKKDFVSLKTAIPNLKFDLRYYGSHNFVGKPIDGYNTPKCFLTKEAAHALKKVQTDLEEIGFGLLIYDAYRPQRAVNHFIKWARDRNDTLMKAEFYPGIAKKELFKKGYIATKSGHSRGSTVDLTLIYLKTQQPLDMGSAYDLFDDISGINAKNISQNQHNLRILLKNSMQKHGFRPYKKEWWHFTLRNEPYSNIYFDFPIE